MKFLLSQNLASEYLTPWKILMAEMQRIFLKEILSQAYIEEVKKQSYGSYAKDINEME